ncbi:hypothetical protein SISSUDRAFT_56203 [Sistotremastrum suecicum HHB10207 ss-3]|uniref:Uncharacterized protein n=1 Tax=Sistotremastrum suecicum HHB10207 ss-3 TaxID=1314776 RepID=A0A166BPW8_9AGAM|nr:hypothetical protein SISSUDRAFT_56203 [Sistotremastrum suecicum HHB10207 ss-3]
MQMLQTQIRYGQKLGRTLERFSQSQRRRKRRRRSSETGCALHEDRGRDPYCCEVQGSRRSPNSCTSSSRLNRAALRASSHGLTKLGTPDDGQDVAGTQLMQIFSGERCLCLFTFCKLRSLKKPYLCRWWAAGRLHKAGLRHFPSAPNQPTRTHLAPPLCGAHSHVISLIISISCPFSSSLVLS